MHIFRCFPYICLSWIALNASAQSAPSAPSVAPHRIEPDYPIPYAPAEVDAIFGVLERLHAYIDAETPPLLVDRSTGKPVETVAEANGNVDFAPSEQHLLSYEWGVTYSGMLLAHEVTGDQRFRDYVGERMRFLARVAGAFASMEERGSDRRRTPVRSMLRPRSLDDAGSMAAAMIKAERAIPTLELDQFIDRYLTHISQHQKRLPDGTLARDRPLPDAVWLDDLYMSVPALAQMAVRTGESRYFDDAVHQIRRFAKRLFLEEHNLYRHAWIKGMSPHPSFLWGRANGWALLAKTELLSVLPSDHPGYADVLELYRRHAAGLAAVQGIDGRWHQLLDRPETYPETSASAIFTFCLARGINRGWLDPLAYGPAVSLAWNAVAEQVNDRGQVEGACVGTGIGFEPMFYAYRPTSVRAGHGYGPVLLAAAEMITLRKGAGRDALISDGAVQFAPSPSRF